MTPVRDVVPGTWYAVLGSGAVVLLPPEEKRRVAAVWSLVDDGAGFDEVLDALIADGLRDLAGFALVSDRDGDARVVLRGSVTAVLYTAEGEVRVEGATAATWVEREVRGVNGFRVEVDGEWYDVDRDDEEPLTLRDGIARVGGVEELPVAEPAPARVASVATEPHPGPEPEPEPHPEPAPEPTPGPEEATTQHVPEQPVDEGPSTRLVLSTGETVEVDRPVVLGRAPDPARSDAADPRLVSLPSPSREISSTHREIRPSPGPGAAGVVATDLGSTNGSVVVQPGSPPEELPVGVAVPLLPGAVIDLGDGISIEVVEP